MWNKVAYAMMLLLIGPVAMAAGAPDLPSIFKPVPDDLSVWYLGNIFGSDLIPGQNIPNQMLLSQLFGVFNQVILAVGLSIGVYTILIGTLNTAGEGKAMGEKWHSFWIPIRMMSGIGMLIPKAGSGYCMAQYIVIWMTMQGIGAADSVWNTMLDYFKEGGSIYSTNIGSATETNFTYANMDYTYSLQSTGPVGDSDEVVALLRSMVCMDKFNAQSEQARNGETYAAYIRPDRQNVLIFGNQKKYDYSDKLANYSGAECGIIKLGTNTGQNNNKKTSDKNSHAQFIDVTYITGMRKMMSMLRDVSLAISLNKVDTPWDKYYPATNLAMQSYINWIVMNSGQLVPQDQMAEMVAQLGANSAPNNLDIFKQFGWLLAGNYYTLLSHIGEKAQVTKNTFVMPSAEGIDSKWEYQAPKNANSSEDMDTVKDIKSFFTRFAENPKAMYDAPNSEWKQEQADQSATYNGTAGVGSAASPLTKSKMEDIQKAVGATNSDKLTGVTAKEVKTFMKYLTGTQNGGFVSQDPILKAAKHGKHLTEAAVAMMVAFSATWVISMLTGAAGSCMSPGYATIRAAMDMVTPMVVALGAFMYAEGAMLGVFIPVIPYLTFLTGVVGWFLGVIEAVAAAPLVAIGLVLPESKDDIWGRAAPAYMLTLNLFLRPSLMIIGFAAAMIVTWVTVEILNIGFLTMVSSTFRIENLFGFVTIMMAYTAIFTYIVTESYSLINVVPNKVLHWIGDQSQGVKGAEEAIGGAKQGAESGGRSVAAGAGALQTKADMYRATDHVRKGQKKADEPAKNTPS